MRPLVILRPEPGAGRTAAFARQLGLATRIVPLFEVIPLAWSAPDPSEFDALVITSANAIRFGSSEIGKLKRLPVHAVGEASAAAARKAGFTVASIGAGGAETMTLPGSQRLLHLAGADHRPVQSALAIPVYQARAIDYPDGLGELAGSVVAVHSPRAGRRLSELVAMRSSTAIVAISPAAATACGSGWLQVEAAAQPSDAALLALAASLCESPWP
jgi:uroporphyrinogen-III synthase